MKYFNLFFSLLKFQIIKTWRYKINTISGIIFMSVMCIGLLFGASAVLKGSYAGFNKLAFIGGYILWIIVQTNYQTISNIISSNAEVGTLEQLYINTYNIIIYYLFQCTIAFILNTLIMYLIISIIILVTGISINIGILTIIPILILGLPALWGVSLGVGSLILVFKKIDSVSTVVSSLLIASSPYLVQKSRIISLIYPFGLANKIIQDIFSGKISISDVSGNQITIILINNLVYFALGISMYKISERYAKQYGRLGQY